MHQEVAILLRICNAVAHSLAKADILVIGPVFWKEVSPPWLEKLLVDDVYV